MCPISFSLSFEYGSLGSQRQLKVLSDNRLRGSIGSLVMFPLLL